MLIIANAALSASWIAVEDFDFLVETLAGLSVMWAQGFFMWSCDVEYLPLVNACTDYSSKAVLCTNTSSWPAAFTP